MRTVELFRFPHAPGDPLTALLASATRNLERHGHLPWMLLGATETERLAVVGAGSEPGELAEVEGALLGVSDCVWTALAGVTLLQSGAGWLHHAFVRQRRPDGRWQAWVRPQTDTAQGIAWLGEWTPRHGEQLPESDPLFPTPQDGGVRLVRPAPPPTASWRQDVPAAVMPEALIEQLGAVACRWFATEGTLPPMVLRQLDGGFEGRAFPETALAVALSDAAIRWAQQPDTLAVGTWRRRAWTEGGPGAQRISVVLEVRGGPALHWDRRYRVEDKQARWEGPGGQRSLRPVGSPRTWLR